jgi:hypothetical protein
LIFVFGKKRANAVVPVEKTGTLKAASTHNKKDKGTDL